MAMTHAKATVEAEAVQQVCERFLNVYDTLIGILDHNSALSIDWGNATKPAALIEDAAGNLEGLQFTRQQVANAIGTLAAIQTLMGQGHLGNLNLLARPSGRR
jgi:hypothetical protein